MSVDKFGRHLISSNGDRNILQVNGNFDFRGKRLTNVAIPIESTDVVIKEYIDNNFLTSAGGEHYNLRNKRIKQLHAPLADSDAVNKQYVDAVKTSALQLAQHDNLTPKQFDAKTLRIVQIGAPLANDDAVNKKYVDTLQQHILKPESDETWNFRNKRVKNVGNPVDRFDAVNKSYVDEKNLTRDGHYSLAGKRLTNVGDPISVTDAASKSYVERVNAQTRYYIDGKPTIKRTGLMSDFDFEGRLLHNVQTPRQPFDGVNKEYVDFIHNELKAQLQLLNDHMKSHH